MDVDEEISSCRFPITSSCSSPHWRPNAGNWELATGDWQLFLIVRRIHRNVVLPFFRRLVEGEDGLHRAGWNARPTVDALVGVDIQHFRRCEIRFVFPRVNTVNRT